MRRHAASHPEVVATQADLLWSINERLAGREGMDVPRLGRAWLDDVIAMAERESASLEDLENA